MVTVARHPHTAVLVVNQDLAIAVPTMLRPRVPLLRPVLRLHPRQSPHQTDLAVGQLGILALDPFMAVAARLMAIVDLPPITAMQVVS